MVTIGAVSTRHDYRISSPTTKSRVASPRPSVSQDPPALARTRAPRPGMRLSAVPSSGTAAGRVPASTSSARPHRAPFGSAARSRARA